MQVNNRDSSEGIPFRLDVSSRDQTPSRRGNQTPPRRDDAKLTSLWSKRESRASVHSWPSKKELNEFQVLSTSAPSALSILSHPLATGAGVEHPLQKLLRIGDSKLAKTRFKEWEELLRETKTQQVATIASQTSQKYLQDVARSSLKIGEVLFSEKEFSDDPNRLQRIAEAIKEQLWQALAPSLKFDAKAIEILRYMVQDLLDQSLFAIDPEFIGKASQSYAESGQLLVGLGYDDELVATSKKNSFLGVSGEPGSIVIKAVQYWKVVSAHSPITIKGFDAHCVTIFIDVAKMQPEKLLLSSDAAMVSIMFHGFRPQLEHIAF